MTPANLPPLLAVIGRTHLLLLHFPIALLYAVLALEIVFRKRIPAATREAVVRPLLLLTATAAVVTAATGLLYGFAEDFHGHELTMLVQHRTGGLVSAALSVSTFIACIRPELKKAYLPLLFCTCVGVVYTGHGGGQMVHGEGYVLEPLTKKHDGDDDKKDDGADRIVASDGDDGAEDQRLRYPEGKAVEKPDYVKDIKPIFDRSCVKCHGPEKRKSGLRLDKKRFAMKGGETGPAIAPGDVEKSLVTKYISLPDDDDDVMPSKGKLLAKSEIETIKNWVKQGAEWPDDPAP